MKAAFQSTNTITTAKFLGVCPPSDAVQWLKERRDKTENVNHASFLEDHEVVETVLLERNDPYIDFGLARYGFNQTVAQKLYAKGDEGLRCVILANVPHGGFDFLGSRFVVGQPKSDNVVELTALISNPNLDDQVFELCFERKGVFSEASDETYRSILLAVSDNPRLATPYDDRWMDGWSDYSYHKVFSAAWTLTTTLPATKEWAGVLYHLLRKCLPPSGFDPVPVISRWHIEDTEDQRGVGFYLRSRLADLLKADEALLGANDLALRISFYRRFDPRSFPNWPELAERDGEEFLQAAFENKLIWRSEADRELLGRLCWDHPDPRHNMDMPNYFRATEDRMEKEHPDWFTAKADRAPTPREIWEKLALLEEQMAEIASSSKSFWKR